ncbi:MAG: hypothetical protein ACOCZ8_01220 [Bacteroidota bacterium]
MAQRIVRQTHYFLRDLHARESMRLGWYRMARGERERLSHLRATKAQHIAFLRDALRRRNRGPVWYARPFYLFGLGMGLFWGRWSTRLNARINQTIERWILLRYRNYFRKLKLEGDLRSMTEAVQLKRFEHNEPGADVLELLERYMHEEEQVTGENAGAPQPPQN